MTPEERRELGRQRRQAGRRIVEEQTRRQVRTFLDELRNRTAHYRTIASLRGQVAQEYRGRAVMELLQNAHDVLAVADGDDPRRISFVLRRSPVPELLVANSGRPFRHEDFSGICQLAQSPKDPNESVGNKGLGFQSVLELSTRPEVWSTAPAGIDISFAFGFDPGVRDPIARVAGALAQGEQRPTDDEFGSEPVVEWSEKQISEYLESLEAGAIDLREEVDRYLSPYVFPRPLDEPSDHVAGLLADGHVTVIRLPLDGGRAGGADEAVESVREQLKGLDEAAMVFLPHLSVLRIEVDEEAVELTRRVEPDLIVAGTRREPDGAAPGTRHARVLVGRTAADSGDVTERSFHVWSRIAGGPDRPEETERIAAAVRHLPNRWPEVRKVEVAVAVEETREARPGAFVIFLPTAMETGVGAHVNAPFHGSLDRTKIDFGDEYNELLLEFVTDLVIDAVADLVRGPAEVWRGWAVIDLLGRIRGSHASDDPGLTRRLRERARDRDGPLDRTALILCDDGWRLPGDARTMPKVPSDDPIGEPEWRLRAGFAVASSALDERREAVEALLRSLGGTPGPLPGEWARTLERMAERVGAGDTERTGMNEAIADEVTASWDGFLRSVVALLPPELLAEPDRSDSDPLADARFLPAEDGRLLAASDRAQLFFRPRRSADDTADFVGSVPDSLKHVVAFLHPGVTTHEGQPQRNTPVQKFLDGRFVRGFRRENLLRLIIRSLPELPATHGTAAATRCAEALAWSLEIVGPEEQERLLQLLGGLPVACADGWFAMEDAVFGPRWEGRSGDHLVTLADALPDARADLLGRALLPPGDDRWRIDVSNRGDLFASAGVAEGIRLVACDPVRYWMSRAHPKLPEGAPGSVPQPAWDDWRKAAIDEVEPHHKGHFEYEVKEVSALPALHREDLGDAARHALSELILASFAHWADGWEDATIWKTTPWHWSQAVTSPLKHWLATQPWLHGGPHPGTEKPLSQRWFVPEYLLRGRAGHFRHLSPLPLPLARRLAGDAELLNALKTLGLNIYPTEDARTGPALLEALADAKDRNVMPVGGFDVFLGQVRRAWRHLDPDRGLPTRFIVRTKPRTAIIRTVEELSDVYLPDDEANTRALREHEQPIMAMLPNEANGEAGQRLRKLGARRASRLDARCTVDGRRVVDEASGVSTADMAHRPRTPAALGRTQTLDEAGLRWLPAVLLALHAHGGGNPGGPATKAWGLAARRLRRVRVRQCRTIRVELVDGERIVARSRPRAHWLSGSGVLLLHEQIARDGMYEMMAGAAQAIMDRRDLLKDLRLVLGSLGGNRAPTRKHVDTALERAEIDAVAVADIRLKWIGTAALVDRIRPVLLILDLPDDDLDPKSTDAARLTARLEPEIGQIAADELVVAALESDNDFEMGFRTWRILGEAAELPKWNAVLSDLGGEYVPVTNEYARNQAKRHLYEMARPLRAFARHIATADASAPLDDQAKLFAEVRAAHERLDTNEEWNRLCEEWASRWWRVPFAEVFGLVRSRYARIAAVEPHLRALDGVGTLGRLKEALRTCAVSLEPDPLDVARSNQYRLNRTVRRVWDVYRAWLGSEKTDSAPAARAPTLGLEDRMYLRESPGADFFARAKNTIHDAEFLEATAGCDTVEEMCEKLGINCDDRPSPPPPPPPVVIAGRIFEVGGPEMYRDIYEHLAGLPKPPDGPGVQDLD